MDVLIVGNYERWKYHRRKTTAFGFWYPSCPPATAKQSRDPALYWWCWKRCFWSTSSLLRYSTGWFLGYAAVESLGIGSFKWPPWIDLHLCQSVWIYSIGRFSCWLSCRARVAQFPPWHWLNLSVRVALAVRNIHTCRQICGDLILCDYYDDHYIGAFKTWPYYTEADWEMESRAIVSENPERLSTQQMRITKRELMFMASCIICGKEIPKINEKYCSLDCVRADKAKTRNTKTCPVCGMVFPCGKTQKKQTCSKCLL